MNNNIIIGWQEKKENINEDELIIIEESNIVMFMAMKISFN